jgi:hypothetical protein
MIEARWPNTTLDISHPTVAQTSGGSYVNGGTGLWTGTISDVKLPSRPAGYWNGATLNICLGPCWIWQTGLVTDSSVPQQVTFTFSNQGDSLVPTANNAYFLTGKLTELDAPGEWFRDSGTANLFFWTPLGDNPSQHSVEAKHRTLAFNLNGLSYITVSVQRGGAGDRGEQCGAGDVSGKRDGGDADAVPGGGVRDAGMGGPMTCGPGIA